MLFAKYRAKRKAEYEKKAYHKGFSWAMTAFYLEDKPINEIESYLCSTSFDTHYSNCFNRGVDRALAIIKGSRNY